MTTAERLRAVMEKASERPWHYCDDGETSTCNDEYGRYTVHGVGCNGVFVKRCDANAALIVALANCAEQIAAVLGARDCGDGGPIICRECGAAECERHEGGCTIGALDAALREQLDRLEGNHG